MYISAQMTKYKKPECIKDYDHISIILYYHFNGLRNVEGNAGCG